MSQPDQKLQTLKGFRDFLPKDKRKREYVQQKITEVFELFGFQPLETPTLEYADLLLGKYGEEADKLIYNFEDRGGRNIGLRYDQTVPTARVLSQYHNLPKYFRRYQIQNVFRADKPQKGRFREFLQTDIDIFGSKNEIADAEIIACTYYILKNIGFTNLKLHVNHREYLINALQPIAEKSNIDVLKVIQILDKLDKLPKEIVRKELQESGIPSELVFEAIERMEKEPIPENLYKILHNAEKLGVEKKFLEFKPTLARGLDYYTGMICEIKIDNEISGSLGGGGRYDNLIGQLGGPSMPAVGLALGFDRIVEYAEELGILPDFESSSQVLVTVFDENVVTHSLEAATALRTGGISVEVYPAADKLGKQIKYADDNNIPFVVIIGPDEAEKGIVSLKNMKTGEEKKGSIDTLISELSIKPPTSII